MIIASSREHGGFCPQALRRYDVDEQAHNGSWHRLQLRECMHFTWSRYHQSLTAPAFAGNPCCLRHSASRCSNQICKSEKNAFGGEIHGNSYRRSNERLLQNPLLIFVTTLLAIMKQLVNFHSARTLWLKREDSQVCVEISSEQKMSTSGKSPS